MGFLALICTVFLATLDVLLFFLEVDPSFVVVDNLDFGDFTKVLAAALETAAFVVAFVALLFLAVVFTALLFMAVVFFFFYSKVSKIMDTMSLAFEVLDVVVVFLRVVVANVRTSCCAIQVDRIKGD